MSCTDAYPQISGILLGSIMTWQGFKRLYSSVWEQHLNGYKSWCYPSVYQEWHDANKPNQQRIIDVALSWPWRQCTFWRSFIWNILKYDEWHHDFYLSGATLIITAVLLDIWAHKRLASNFCMSNWTWVKGTSSHPSISLGTKHFVESINIMAIHCYFDCLKIIIENWSKNKMSANFCCRQWQIRL
jgi:hypothetical protein